MTVFLCVLGVLLLLLCLPLSLWIVWENEPEVSVGYLFFRFQLSPAENRPKKEKKQAEKAEKPKKKEEPAQPKALADTAALVLDLIRSATGGLAMAVRNLRVRDLKLRMVVAGEDSAQTALEYGKMNACLYGAYAALQNFISIKRASLEIEPDFLAEEGSFVLRFRVLATPLVLLGAALRIGASFLWKQVKRGLDKPQQPKPAAREAKQPYSNLTND